LVLHFAAGSQISPSYTAYLKELSKSYLAGISQLILYSGELKALCIMQWIVKSHSCICQR
jgi:hypothetical protein